MSVISILNKKTIWMTCEWYRIYNRLSNSYKSIIFQRVYAVIKKAFVWSLTLRIHELEQLK